MSEFRFYGSEKIMDFLGLKNMFESEEYRDYPFRDKISNLEFGYGYITIPRVGIEKIIQNKISDKEYHNILDKIKMLVHIPFYNKRTENFGTIIVNVTIGYRYDKQYKYGDIEKSLPETCYAIERYGVKTNDFYIINEDSIHEFISNYVIGNQWGIGSTKVVSSPKVILDDNFREKDNMKD